MARPMRWESSAHMGSRLTATGTPSRALRMAGVNSSGRGFVPNRRLSSAHPAGAPGTRVGIHPALGMLLVGSSRGMAAAMATAASTALPPAFITSRPIWAPWGMEVQAMALRAYTAFRREG